MRKFALKPHPDQTRLVEFGRFAAADRQRRGEGKPETFAFVGFYAHLHAGTQRTVEGAAADDAAAVAGRAQ